MQRTLEPELMEDPQQALEYALANFQEPNLLFLRELQRYAPQLPPRGAAVDLGCGPGDISLRLLRTLPDWTIDGVDGSEAMLRQAEQAAQREGLADRLRLHHSRIPSTRLPILAYDLVLSNSLLHHLPDPQVMWSTVRRLGAPGAAVMIMDLRRPSSPEAAQALVDQYAAGEPEGLRQDFLASLHAAFTPEEVCEQLAEAGLPLRLSLPSDRHLMVWGFLPPL